MQSGSEAKPFTAYGPYAGPVSFTAISGVSLASISSKKLQRSSGESYTVTDRFALPGPTWCQQFAILLRRILWVRRFEVLSTPDVTIVLAIALVTGDELQVKLAVYCALYVQCSLQCNDHSAPDVHVSRSAEIRFG